MWVIVVAVIGGLIVLGILILSIPFGLVWQVEISEVTRYTLKWYWFFGLLGREIKPGKRAPRKKPPAKAPQKKKPRRFSVTNIKKMIQMARMGPDYLRIRGLVRQIMLLAKRIWRCLKIEKLEAELIIGLDDPVDTFHLFTVTEPVNRLLDHFQPYPIRIWPSFYETTLEGYTAGRVKIYPVQLIPPILGFVFSMPALRLIRKLISDRWKIRRLISKKPQ